MMVLSQSHALYLTWTTIVCLQYILYIIKYNLTFVIVLRYNYSTISPLLHKIEINVFVEILIIKEYYFVIRQFGKIAYRIL